jgi:hypothetical protein
MKQFLSFIIFLVFINLDLKSQCPVTPPTGIDNCSLGAGSIQLGASGSTGFYNWYDAAIGGNLVGSGSTYQTPILASTTNYYVAATDTNYTLDFDGTNDFVALGNPAQLKITGNLTIEMWVKPDNFSTRRNPYAKAYGGEGTITQETNGTLNFYYGTNGGNSTPYQGFNSGSSLTLNEWNHIAIVRDLTNMKLYWYINGVLTATTNASYASATAGSNNATIGSGYVSNYDGQIDELRVWNIARTQAEVQTNKNICLTGAELGLAAYYQINDGINSTIAKDFSVFANNGVLTNMDSSNDWVSTSYDYQCLSCESPRTAVVATVSGGTPVVLGEDECLSGNKILDAGIGYSSYLWSTGDVSQTITVSTDGNYWVQVDNGGGCIGSDTINLTFIDAPIANDTCRIGTGPLTLTASGSTGSYNWYDAPVGGNLLSSNTTYTTPSLATTTSYYVAATTPNYALDFDGTNDYLSLGNPSQLQITGNLTIEMWVKPDNFSTRRNPYAKAYGGEGTITQETNGTLNFYYGTNGGNTSPYQGFNSGTALSLNQWNHIAIVRDLTNMKLYWYINGVLTATTNASYASATAGLNNATIGSGYVSNYDGQIDELRIWSAARTQVDIQSNMSFCIDPSSSNLNAYYKLNDGTGSLTASDLSAYSNNATLTNMDVNSDWINSTSGIGCECESDRTTVTATIFGGTPLNLGNDTSFACGTASILLNAGAGYSNYLWSTGATSQSINANTAGTYWVQVTNGSGCSDADTISVSDVGGSLTALDFDGTNDYVTLGNPSQLQITGNLTIEMWVKPDNFSARRNPYAKAYGGEGTITQETNGTLNFYYGTNGGNAAPYQGFNSGSALTLNQWNHIAIVRDLTNMKLHWYINGVLTATTNASYASATAGTNNATIGSGYVSNYDGQIDELRIWRAARTQTEIKNKMCSKLIGTETGLTSYYNFNNGSGLTLTDKKSNLNGTLTNMDAASDWVTSGAAIGDKSIYLYPGSWTGQSLNLASCNGDFLDVRNVSGAVNGIHIYYVDKDPSSTTGINSFNVGNHYFGVFKTNNPTATYQATFNYTNHSLVNTSNEEDVLLLKRNNNADLNWVDASATNNTTLNTLTATSSNTEYIIDLKEFIWTGATSTDWATASNWNLNSVPLSGASVKIPNVPNKPILDANRAVGRLSIDVSSSVNLNAFNLSVTKDLTTYGTITCNGGTLIMNGTKAQLINTSSLTIQNITINNTFGVSLNSGNMNLAGTMTLTNGAFNTNNGLTILSNASGTGRIAEITGGSIAGNITMQRYIDAGATNWRFISSAVSNAAITQLNDDFETSGYPGSLFPNWPTAANPWPSVYYYDETVAGVQDNGYVAPTSGTNTIGTGEGLWVWCGDTITGTQPFTLDLTGAANTGNINLPVTYTNTGLPSDDGWNMVGNPYPSTLDWDSPNITKSNINNAIYIWNPDLEQFASYVGGFGTNGGSRYVASTQAFWVQASAASPSIQVTETSKSNTDATFLKTTNTLPLVFNVQNNYGTDEMVINLNNDATTLFDPMYDAGKLASSNANLPYICSVINNNTDLSINQVPAQETIIPIKVKSGASGLHTISIDNISEYDYLNCIFLEDVLTGTTYNLFNQQSFMIFISDTTTVARFLLHIGTSNTLSTIDPSCMEINNGLIVIENNSTTGFETTLTDSEGNIVANNIGVYNTDSIYNLSPGTYTIQTNDPTCGSVSETVTLAEPSSIIASFTHSNTALNYTFTNTSLNGTSYLWDFGDGNVSTLENPDYTFLSEGTYLVTLTVYQDETCFTITSQWITIVTTGIETINNVETKVWINDNALFINTSTEQFETYQIKNTLGQILVSESFNKNNKARYNLNNISSQVLFVTLFSPNNSKTIKIVYNK